MLTLRTSIHTSTAVCRSTSTQPQKNRGHISTMSSGIATTYLTKNLKKFDTLLREALEAGTVLKVVAENNEALVGCLCFGILYSNKKFGLVRERYSAMLTLQIQRTRSLSIRCSQNTS